jgi:F-type H+-transporting ATPase subunit gamma
MSDTIESLNRKIHSAGDMQSVVRTMKALAASSIGQYEKSVRALADYYHTVELGLSAHFRDKGLLEQQPTGSGEANEVDAVVFGSDQGLVGQFNDIIADYAIQTLAKFPGKPTIWAVGERVHARLLNSGTTPIGLFPVPSSVEGIIPLVRQLQIKSEFYRAGRDQAPLYLFYNRPKTGSLFDPVSQRLLPLDRKWQRGLGELPWPTKNLPEVMCSGTTTLSALIREYLFISLFRACAESLASENASRLAAMQRAEKNIGELLETLHGNYHRLRQSGIDEELFDVISGYEALEKKLKK